MAVEVDAEGIRFPLGKSKEATPAYSFVVHHPSHASGEGTPDLILRKQPIGTRPPLELEDVTVIVRELPAGPAAGSSPPIEDTPPPATSEEQRVAGYMIGRFDGMSEDVSRVVDRLIAEEDRRAGFEPASSDGSPFAPPEPRDKLPTFEPAQPPAQRYTKRVEYHRP
jgi:hypothetical protein